MMTPTIGSPSPKREVSSGVVCELALGDVGLVVTCERYQRRGWFAEDQAEVVFASLVAGLARAGLGSAMTAGGVTGVGRGGVVGVSLGG